MKLYRGTYNGKNNPFAIHENRVSGIATLGCCFAKDRAEAERYGTNLIVASVSMDDSELFEITENALVLALDENSVKDIIDNFRNSGFKGLRIPEKSPDPTLGVPGHKGHVIMFSDENIELLEFIRGTGAIPPVGSFEYGVLSKGILEDFLKLTSNLVYLARTDIFENDSQGNILGPIDMFDCEDYGLGFWDGKDSNLNLQVSPHNNYYAITAGDENYIIGSKRELFCDSLESDITQVFSLLFKPYPSQGITLQDQIKCI